MILNFKNIVPWVVVVIMAVVCVVLINQNRLNQSALSALQDQKDIERKESQERIDSINMLLIENTKEFNKKLLKFNKSKDSLLELYAKSNKELQKIRTDISTYLSSSDAERFSKFKQLITEVD